MVKASDGDNERNDTAPDQRSRKILVIEDDFHSRKLFKDYLAAKGFEVVTAVDGEEGEKVWIQERPNAVVLDGLLPKIDGLGLLKMMRKRPEGKNTPVVIATAIYKSFRHKREARKLGVNSYLVKPFPLRLLEQELRYLLGEKVEDRISFSPPVRGSKEKPVERVSRITLPPLGNLDRHKLPDLIHFLYANNRTGLLQLRWGISLKVIHFLNGCPVWVESNLRTDTLGVYLLKNELISKDVHDRALEIMSATGRKIGDVLIELGAISPNDLYKALYEHQRLNVLSCFSWDGGDFKFQKVSEFPGDITVVKQEPARLVIDGIDRYFDINRVKRLLNAPGGARVILNDASPYVVDQLHLSIDEQRIYDLACSGFTINEICEMSGSRNDALKLIFSLSCLEVIHLSEEEEPVETPLFLKSIPPPPPPEISSELKAKRDDLIKDYLRMKEMNCFELLGVDLDASRIEIERAAEALLSRFHPDRWLDAAKTETTELTDIKNKTEEMYLKIKEARDILLDQGRRENYVENMERRQSAMLASADLEGRVERAIAIKSEQIFQDGIRLLKAKDNRAASEKFRKAAVMTPNEPSYQAYLGWALFLEDPGANGAESESLIRKAISQQPDLDFAHLFLGSILKSNGDLKGARESFKAALKYNPENVEAVEALWSTQD